MAIIHRPELTPDPNCKACRQGWPIHAEADGSKRQHLDLFATPEYGVVQPCPTQDWPDEEEEQHDSQKSSNDNT